jgi:hypothetical protein
LTTAYLALDNPGHAMFATRLGLTVAELCGPYATRYAVIDKIRHLATHADAYIACEILASTTADRLTPETLAMLRATLSDAAIGQPLAPGQARQLTDSVASAVRIVAASLTDSLK